MNLVLDDAEEVHMKTQNRKTLGMCIYYSSVWNRLHTFLSTAQDPELDLNE